MVQVHYRGVGAVGFAACDGVAGDELIDFVAHDGTGGGDHVGFGAAGVGDDGAGVQVRQDRGQDAGCLRDRRGQQDQVGAGDCLFKPATRPDGLTRQTRRV